MAAFNSFKQAVARERLTIANAVQTLTQSIYDDTANAPKQKRITAARIQLLTGSGDITFTEDGTTPTADNTTAAGVGSSASAGDIIYLESYAAVNRFKAIRVTATSAIVEVTYYR